MNDFVIGSFFTEGTPYEKISQDYLEKSFANLKYDTERIKTPTQVLNIQSSKNYGNWYRNVAEKPKIILDMLNKLDENMCLVFLDADARIMKYPYLFHDIPKEYDIAFHTLNWNFWYGYKNIPPIKELLTGTMFFRKKEEVLKLCKNWYNMAIQTKEWEQKALQKIINSATYNLKIYELPIEYCMMNTLPNNQPPIVNINNAVILHYQMSRIYKKRIL